MYYITQGRVLFFVFWLTTSDFFGGRDERNTPILRTPLARSGRGAGGAALSLSKGEGGLPSPAGRGAGGEGGFRYASLLNPQVQRGSSRASARIETNRGRVSVRSLALALNPQVQRGSSRASARIETNRGRVSVRSLALALNPRQRVTSKRSKGLDRCPEPIERGQTPSYPQSI